MVQKSLRCPNCETLNCAEVSKQNPNAVFWCKNCGFAFNPNPENLAKIDDPNQGNWLLCIPLKGFEAREPLGKNPSGYIDPVNGGAKPHSRQEYMDMFSIDPQIYLNFVKRNRPHKVPGFDCK